MHAIHRPRLEWPRALLLGVGAAVVAIVISLLVATGLNDISASGGAPERPQPVTATANGSGTQPREPAWITNPFAPVAAGQMKPLWKVQAPKA